MEDKAIVALYWQRNQEAIRVTQGKYGAYLSKIAWQILYDREEGEECVNDTYLKAWNSMPIQRPTVLSTYLGKIVRGCAIDRFRHRHRQKRQASEYALSLEELAECLSDGDATQEAVDLHLLGEAIDTYLRTLPPPARRAFVARYYYMDPIRAVAVDQGLGLSQAKSLLHRTRLGLREHLRREGFSV
ncbi:RNA polymerase sigma factor [Intestinimonas sp. HCP28S3_D6]|uniref:RNA polymerase sigma factor n=1 Tax=Intestinimonas sp. HCP28S3_D6 TaxID=3438942 RepID=UPI003F8B680B